MTRHCNPQNGHSYQTYRERREALSTPAISGEEHGKYEHHSSNNLYKDTLASGDSLFKTVDTAADTRQHRASVGQ